MCKKPIAAFANEPPLQLGSILVQPDSYHTHCSGSPFSPTIEPLHISLKISFFFFPNTSLPMYFTCIIRFHCCVCFLSTDRLDRLITPHTLESKQNRQKTKPLKASRRESHSAQLSLMLGYSSFVYNVDHVARDPPLLSLLTLCLVAIAMQNIQGPKMESTKHTHPERTGNIAQQHG